MPIPKALDHVGIVVSHLEASLRFYQALGLELLRVTGPKADGARIAVLRVGAQELNVICPPGVEHSEPRLGSGMDHFCLQMDAASAEHLLRDLRAAGIDVVRGPVERREGASVFVLDPDGVHVELLIKNPR